MEKTDGTMKEWLSANMPASFLADIPPEEVAIIAHTLVYSEQFEEYVNLHFKSIALIISLQRGNSDERIFKHYSDRGITEYRKYVSKIDFPGYDLPLRITKLSFSGANDAPVVMPKNVNAQALIDSALEQDNVAMELSPGEKPDETVVCFAWRNVQKKLFLYNLARMVTRHELKLGDMRLAYLNPYTTKSVLTGTIQLSGVKDDFFCFQIEFQSLKTARLSDPMAPLVDNGTLNGNQAYVFKALAAIIEQILTEVNASMYTEDAIFEAFLFHPELSLDVWAMFKARFNPRKHSEEEYVKLRAELEDKLQRLDTGRKKHDDRRRAIFQQAINVMNHMLRTNAFTRSRLGIGFRLNPEYLDNVPGFDRRSKFPELPYSVFFVRGQTYMGMQVRFRDLARGGMRTIVSWDAEHEKFERPNMFTECYNLAFTQQKKNKDIPEGGSKAICFVANNEILSSEMAIARRELLASGIPADQVDKQVAQLQRDMTLEYMYYNQRCFFRTWLSLFVWDFEKSCLKHLPDAVDLLRIPEFIYVGPDENFHDSMIAWLAKESVRMGYYSGGAFISGKADAGVNHKDYGVTSWGALQFLNQAMAFVGINDGPFTVKVTGGPDGDVAGNFMLLMKKYYPTRCKLTLVTDGSGTSFDPQGFDLGALEQLFHKGQMMRDYPAEKLHEGGWILQIKTTRSPTPLLKEVLCMRMQNGKLVEDWISSNAAYHLWGNNAHVTPADVFLPCGGRPRSLNSFNVQDFLDAQGKPTARVIVEGANLYITQEAREVLESKGVILFKDSSSNKCGVVSSSYEIIAGLTLTDEQFIAIKPTLAQNILSRLQKIANDEASAMLKYYEETSRKVPLSQISELVSKRINRFTDDMAAYLKPLNLEAPENKPLLDLFINYIPEVVRKGHLEQALKRIPDMHKKAIIATHLACSLVYGKGLAWEPTIVDVLPILLK